MTTPIIYCHIKRSRADGKSPHMDRSLCGDLTGPYTVEPTEYMIAAIKREAGVNGGHPLCVRCEAEYGLESEAQ